IKSAAFIDNQQLSILVSAEARDREWSVGQLLVPQKFFAVVAPAPNAASGPVPINISAAQIGEFRAVIDDPACQGTKLRMRMFDSRERHRVGAERAIEIKRMAS